MTSFSTKVGHTLAKGLGINVQEREPYLRGDDAGASKISIQTSDTYVEEEPRTLEFLQSLTPTSKGIGQYVYSLFPFLHWIGFYNWQWLIGDLVAGITIGAVVVPQGMSYATLANLSPQFGLYSSFMGVLIYWFFATSKDITIGPVAVMSQLTGNIVADLLPELPNVAANEIASALSILAGAIVFFIGIIRAGWIVDLIPLSSLTAFMTGSALNIAVGQVPTLMGITGFSTRDPTYLVIIHTLQGLPRTKLDAAMGLTALFLLYLIRYLCNYSARRWPQHQRLAFFISTLRTVFVVLLYTLISWLVNRGLTSKTSHFKILGTVPQGFQNTGAPILNQTIASKLVSYLPATVIVLLIEHISISKIFGRLNNYTIDPSQEMVAIGVTNLLGPFLGGYASTGSFSRTAIKAKAGVRTPLAGVITAAVVLIAIYALTSVFYWIPSASLSAVIIHAVGDLIAPPSTLYKFWRVNPLEVVIFFVGVIVIVFSTIENGVYTTICMSAALLLYRILRSKGRFLGAVKVHSVIGDQVLAVRNQPKTTDALSEYGTFADPIEAPVRNVFLPLGHQDGTNPELEFTQPFPGIFIYRLVEGFTYPNASHQLQYLTEYIFEHTRRTNISHYERPGDRPWNDPGPTRAQRKAAVAAGLDEAAAGQNLNLPTLKAIILDFSTVNEVDVTSIQTLIDVRNQLDRYTAPDVVDWHFANIGSRWTKRALVSAGFGYPAERPDGLHHRWKGIYSVAEIGGAMSFAADVERRVNEKELGPAAAARRQSQLDNNDIEVGSSRDVDPDLKTPAAEEDYSVEPARTRSNKRVALVHGINRPLFHIDLTSALQSAVTNVGLREEHAE